jgi:glycosyltransferase involved in cell wall biosynthesis
MQREQQARISVVGWEREPGREDRQRSVQAPTNVSLLGPKSQIELREMYAQSAIYAATSRYEPFGLAPLEAALSRCALVLNDNPVFHELWNDAGIFFTKDDAEDCARRIDELRSDLELRAEYADRAYNAACEKFAASRMVEQYEKAYQELASTVRLA